jgi:hypothetical protein
LIAEHPDNAGLHFLLAVAYYDLKDLDRTEASLQQAIAHNPRMSSAYTWAGNAGNPLTCLSLSFVKDN